MILPDTGLTALFGIADENLRAIEDAFRVRLQSRGSEISVMGEGPAEDAARRLLAGLSDLLAAGYPLREPDVATAIRVVREDPAASLVEFFTDSPFGPTLKSVVTVRNLKQRIYAQTIDRHDLVFAIGPAGTGKTYLAVAMAAAALVEKKVKRIVLARPAVEAGEKLGFLPGDLVEKVNPYLRPLYDALYDILGYEKTAKLLERGIIEVAPIAFMRGRTLNDAFIILDEAQNTTSEQMKMFLTRIGFGSKAVVTGRHHADRPASGKDLRPARGPAGPVPGRGDPLRALQRAGRGAPHPRAVDHHGLRGARPRAGSGRRRSCQRTGGRSARRTAGARALRAARCPPTRPPDAT